jgi:NitT/TauT family transport system substrate-binding protein
MHQGKLAASRAWQALAALVVATLIFSAPLHAQTKWKHCLLVVKANAGFLFMGLEKAFFKKRGLDVEFVQLRGDRDVARALMAGECESAEISPGASISIMEKGGDLRFFGSAQPGFPYALYVRPDITSWDQLKDKTFGVSGPGSVPEIMARAMLHKKGIDASGIKVVNAGGSGARIQALVAGKVDAVASSSQYSADAARLGIKVMGFAADIVPEYPSTIFVAKNDTLKANRETVISFLAGYMEGLDYALSHRDEMLRLAGKLNNKAPDNPELVFTFDEAVQMHYFSVKSEIPRDKLEWLQNQLVQFGQIKKKIDLDKYIDESYRQEALKRVHLVTAR